MVLQQLRLSEMALQLLDMVLQLLIWSSDCWIWSSTCWIWSSDCYLGYGSGYRLLYPRKTRTLSMGSGLPAMLPVTFVLSHHTAIKCHIATSPTTHCLPPTPLSACHHPLRRSKREWRGLPISACTTPSVARNASRGVSPSLCLPPSPLSACHHPLCRLKRERRGLPPSLPPDF